jgi:hypothetical protein
VLEIDVVGVGDCVMVGETDVVREAVVVRDDVSDVVQEQVSDGVHDADMLAVNVWDARLVGEKVQVTVRVNVKVLVGEIVKDGDCVIVRELV